MASLDKTLNQLESIYDRIDEIWLHRKKFSTKHENRLRLEIRPLHLLLEQLFHRAWMLYLDQDEDVDLELIEERKVFNGQKEVTRLHYCDGIFHYVTTKKDKLRYGCKCNC